MKAASQIGKRVEKNVEGLRISISKVPLAIESVSGYTKGLKTALENAKECFYDQPCQLSIAASIAALLISLDTSASSKAVA